MEAIDRRFAKDKDGNLLIVRASSFLGGKTKEECDPIIPVLNERLEYVNVSKEDIKPIDRVEIRRLFHLVENEEFRDIIKDYIVFPPKNFKKW